MTFEDDVKEQIETLSSEPTRHVLEDGERLSLDREVFGKDVKSVFAFGVSGSASVETDQGIIYARTEISNGGRTKYAQNYDGFLIGNNYFFIFDGVGSSCRMTVPLTALTLDRELRNGTDSRRAVLIANLAVRKMIYDYDHEELFSGEDCPNFAPRPSGTTVSGVVFERPWDTLLNCGDSIGLHLSRRMRHAMPPDNFAAAKLAAQMIIEDESGFRRYSKKDYWKDWKGRCGITNSIGDQYLSVSSERPISKHDARMGFFSDGICDNKSNSQLFSYLERDGGSVEIVDAIFQDLKDSHRENVSKIVDFEPDEKDPFTIEIPFKRDNATAAVLVRGRIQDKPLGLFGELGAILRSFNER